VRSRRALDGPRESFAVGKPWRDRSSVRSTGMHDHLLVMAKAPVPGRSKTRLCPPCTPDQAAAIAEAALADVLDAVAACGAGRKLLALDGSPGEWLPAGFEVFPQQGDGFDERLAHAWRTAGGPGLQVGMDTPQVTATELDDALARLHDPGVDAVLGPALDGGWWAIGLHRPDDRVFLGIPMSRDDTGRRQRDRLDELGLRTAPLPALLDIDHFDDARTVAALAPRLRTAKAVAAVQATLTETAPATPR